MKVSVQVLTYNHEFCIQRCLKSILGQNFTEFEIVVGVDLSKDSTLEIVKKFQNNSHVPIKVVEQIKQVGPFKNFSDIIKLCEGEYIAICDGDDFWTDPDKLQIQYEIMKADRDLTISFHKSSMRDSEERLIRTLPLDAHKNYKISTSTLVLHESIMPSSSIMYKNYRIQEFVSVFEGLRDIVDLPLVTYLSTFGDIRYIDRNMSTYIQASNFDAFSSKNIAYKCIEANSMFNQINEFTSKKYEYIISQKILRNYINIFLYEVTRNELTIARSTFLLINRKFRRLLKNYTMLILSLLIISRILIGRIPTEYLFKFLNKIRLIKYE